ncbi:response regulator [Flagellimonas sp.]|uniref:response regulator n=1 Tax=Flagellimonas sp. TaxID=2058762 RepID=UPI003F4A0966
MKKILLVEDDTSLRENIAELLDLSGFLVFDAAHGKIAVDIAKKELPDIILCDIMMPELDGYGVLEELSSHPDTRHIPFIFISAKTERQDVRKGMNLGADDYLTKPFEEEELLNAIHTRLQKAKFLDSSISRKHQKKGGKNQIRSLHELKNFFDDYGQIASFQKEDTVFSEGEHSNFIYLILKGVVKCYRLDEQGKELITALYGADEFLGFTSLLENLPHQEYAVAIENVEMAGIAKSELRTILEDNKKVSLELMEVLAGNITEIKKQLLQMAYSSVRKKTAQTLLQFEKAMNKGPKKSLHITRSDLAHVAGVATESLIRTLSDFKHEGLIEVKNRDIRILDRDTLMHIQ